MSNANLIAPLLLVCTLGLPDLAYSGDAAYTIDERYIASLTGEKNVPPEVIATLSGHVSKSFADKQSLLDFLEGELGKETLQIPVSKKQSLESKLIRFADARIGNQLAQSSLPVPPLQHALGEVALNEAISSGEYRYIGNLKCRVCHREFFLGRKIDGHGHSFTFNLSQLYETEAKCVICHTTGYGVESGFTNTKATRKLRNVTCEGCHGPGSKHNEIGDKGGFLAGTDKPAILMRMCEGCHDSLWNHSFTDLNSAYESYRNAEANANN